MIYVLYGVLAFSTCLNIALGLYVLKKPKKTITQSYDVQALLRDLASGPALVKIEYMDRADVLIRSPRHFS